MPHLRYPREIRGRAEFVRARKIFPERYRPEEVYTNKSEVNREVLEGVMETHIVFYVGRVVEVVESRIKGRGTKVYYRLDGLEGNKCLIEKDGELKEWPMNGIGYARGLFDRESRKKDGKIILVIEKQLAPSLEKAVESVAAQ